MLVVYTDGSEVIVCDSKDEQKMIDTYFCSGSGRMTEDTFDELTVDEIGNAAAIAPMAIYERVEFKGPVAVSHSDLRVDG